MSKMGKKLDSLSVWQKRHWRAGVRFDVYTFGRWRDGGPWVQRLGVIAEEVGGGFTGPDGMQGLSTDGSGEMGVQLDLGEGSGELLRVHAWDVGGKVNMVAQKFYSQMHFVHPLGKVMSIECVLKKLLSNSCLLDAIGLDGLSLGRSISHLLVR